MRLSLRQSQSIEAILLLGILALAALLRFDQLGQRGLIYWDEGKFALEGVRMLAYLQSWFGQHFYSWVGKSVGTAKPTHALLIGLSYAIFGIHDYAALYMDAFFSVLEVAVLYLLARKLFGPSVALIATLFLAVSEYDVIYARSALSESDADLLFLIGVFVWILAANRLGAVEGEEERRTAALANLPNWSPCWNRIHCQLPALGLHRRSRDHGSGTCCAAVGLA